MLRCLLKNFCRFKFVCCKSSRTSPLAKQYSNTKTWQSEQTSMEFHRINSQNSPHPLGATRKVSRLKFQIGGSWRHSAIRAKLQHSPQTKFGAKQLSNWASHLAQAIECTHWAYSAIRADASFILPEWWCKQWCSKFEMIIDNLLVCFHKLVSGN